VLLALLGRGPLFGAHIGGPSPLLPGVCLTAAAALVPHTGSELSLSGLSPGVRATLNAANVCAAHPTAGQALALTVTLLPIDLLRLGALYLAARLARTAARRLHRPGRPAAADPRLVAAGWQAGGHRNRCVRPDEPAGPVGHLDLDRASGPWPGRPPGPAWD